MALSVFLLMCLSGCKTKYVSVPEYHTQYIARTDTVEKTDSIHIKDSVYVVQKGDSVFSTRIIYRDRVSYIHRVKTDSFIKRDTIYVPKPVERTLTKSEQRYITLGKYAVGVIVALAVVIIALAVWLWHRKKG